MCVCVCMRACVCVCTCMHACVCVWLKMLNEMLQCICVYTWLAGYHSSLNYVPFCQPIILHYALWFTWDVGAVWILCYITISHDKNKNKERLPLVGINTANGGKQLYLKNSAFSSEVFKATLRTKFSICMKSFLKHSLHITIKNVKRNCKTDPRITQCLANKPKQIYCL